jgi:transcriptional regulator with XRE-family HTH domain
VTIKSIQDARYRTTIHVLRESRLSSRLSQSDLAALLGRSQQFVSKYESFERRLDVIEYTDVAKALAIDWLTELGRVAKMPKET